MSSYSDFERSQILAMKSEEEKDLDCIQCPKCRGQWFEQVEVSRFQNQRQVVIGQTPPVKPGSIPYILLRCIHCRNLVEPRVSRSMRDLAAQDYDHFLDTLEGKFDSREEKEEKEPADDGIQGEEL